MATTPFPLGVYVGNPNGNDAGAETAFQNQYNAFVQDMGGARPQFMDTFTDFSQDPSTWGANASWDAWSWAQSGANYVGPTSGTVPVVGVPLASNAGGWSNVDTFYQQIIAGQYDADYTGIVNAWAQAGYKTVQFRVAYEFNGNFMPWAPGNSSSPTAQADFIAAFQHVANLIHAAGAANGITAQVVWNPSDINWSVDPTQYYPGDKYVDIIGTDAYSPAYPLDLTTWSGATTGTPGPQASSQAAWASSTTDLEHFWTYSNGSQWSPTPGLGSSGWSIENAIEFAKLHDKPLSISETGAGSSATGLGPADNPAFPQWLAQTLTAAQAQGVKIQNVNIWDTDVSDGSWGFSNGEKPQEAAAWGQYFGTGNTTTVTPPTIPAVTLGTGPDTLTLSVAQDAWGGNAQFTVAVDGTQIGGVQTVDAAALHSTGQTQSFEIAGNFAAGTQSVSVDFLNDAWGGTAATDRNLYVTGAAFNGAAIAGVSLAEMQNGAQGFTFQGVGSIPTVTLGSGADILAVSVSQDAWQGSAQFTVAVDGVQVGGVQTIDSAALHGAGLSQNFDIAGNFAAGGHTVTIDFLNDAWGGTTTTDRNLYVTGTSINGTPVAGGTLTELSAGPQSFSFQQAAISSLSFTDSQGDTYSGPVPDTGSETLYAGQTGLNNNVFQWAWNGVHYVAADAWGYVSTVALTDNTGASFGLSNFVAADATLSGGPTAAGQAASLTIATAQRGTIVLGSGNYDVSFTAANGWGSAADNTVALTMGSGDDVFSLTGSNGQTNAVVHAGSGSDRMSFAVTNSVTVYGGSGTAEAVAGPGVNTFVAGSGTLNVSAGTGIDSFVFHAGAGLLSISDFSVAFGDTLQVDSALLPTMQEQVQSGGLMISFGADTQHGIFLQGVSSLQQSAIHAL